MEEKIDPRDLYMRCGPTIDITEAEEYIGSDLYESIMRGLEEALFLELDKERKKLISDLFNPIENGAAAQDQPKN